MGWKAKITLPLDIEKVDVLGTRQKGKEFIIRVQSQEKTTRCGLCGQEINCNYGKGAKIRLRHLPILGMETYMEIEPKRGQCNKCQYRPTTTQTVSWYVQKSPHTKAYDEHLVKQLIGSTVSDVSKKENVGYDAVLGALKREVPE